MLFYIDLIKYSNNWYQECIHYYALANVLIVGVRDTGEMRIAGVPDTSEMRNAGVQDTEDLHCIHRGKNCWCPGHE